ncbi:2-oxoacid:acceptor oxidoreductase family protein [Archaeoglobus neptunius]|uniref:2-oxoacid:acceptor oxidoreductase family protein n=1 Tax=Archaeoglobus neptunius TaxID=2798580 RepID=UPI00192949FC|nr:2-oxoacid:acceptor oxidoreductase family protein [Archaeoglobus neptunius]
MLKEVTIFSRGGQGGVTAARILATAAMLEGYYSQAMPQFGPERRGAVVKAYLRISDFPIRRRSPVESPDTIAIFDRKIDVPDEAKIFVINSPDPPEVSGKVYYLNASRIAEKYGLINAGWTIVSPVMCGAMAKALEIGIHALKEAIIMEIGDKAEKSTEAAEEAYRVVRWT